MSWRRRSEVEAVLEGYRTAPIDERLRATLAFLEKLTLSPAEGDEQTTRPAAPAGLGRALTAMARP